MTIFDEEAIEAAAKAAYDAWRDDPGAMPWEKWQYYVPDYASDIRKHAKSALTAAEESLRARGMVRDANCEEYSIGSSEHWQADTVDYDEKCTHPVAIIQIKEPTV